MGGNSLPYCRPSLGLIIVAGFAIYRSRTLAGSLPPLILDARNVRGKAKNVWVVSAPPIRAVPKLFTAPEVRRAKRGPDFGDVRRRCPQVVRGLVQVLATCSLVTGRD